MHLCSGATATGNTAVAADGGITGASLLRQAVHAASREGKPLALNFIAQMQPIMANNPYGVSMPHQHPYGPRASAFYGFRILGFREVKKKRKPVWDVYLGDGARGSQSASMEKDVCDALNALDLERDSPMATEDTEDTTGPRALKRGPVQEMPHQDKIAEFFKCWNVIVPGRYGKTLIRWPVTSWGKVKRSPPHKAFGFGPPANPSTFTTGFWLQLYGAGVRQAVAMITAMEHQLGWERSRRQQAEEDCKVLLAAVRMERGVGDALLSAEERRRAEAAEAANKLTLAADELPQASEAATTIQKHVRGRLARKEFESHLRDILRGVDPSLDPAALPLAAQTHVSHVNTLGAPRRLGLRALLGEVVDKSWAAGGSGGDGTVSGPSTLPRDQPHEGATAYYRRQVDRIGQRLAGHRDAGQPHLGDASGDPLQADVKQLLSGSYPASSAQVIAALVRRCRELQAALLEAVGELQQAQLTIEGLKESNSKVSELSALHADLEAARQDNLRLVATVAKLRAAMGLQGPGGAGTGGGGAVAARENPYLAAWYRKAYADSEWQRMPPGGPGGVALLDGPDAAVETWGDLRASVPEPIMVPKVAVPGVHYRDLLSLKQRTPSGRSWKRWSKAPKHLYVDDS
ncbi:hypothetical protein VOLCADRAFT_87666 [Volvox carteri f. nagariensis]|uniref:Uncharacterized protein n=1 Tax=Volvox carteri f. nagariensis TaxID=3068 RepID=D8TLX7_VOLCA|nr:uncharacterized protein VOLCADRAFT_87666 [Volvox carteri f. nagariensis]EFJ51411.1 hypothetical protein VOLCADRAFT_87666 [Volvox carteri f. nagariensis]|eukprot:XP_002947363.1 hypothetical protein VOLCADRAFT_87666 [Volvox carteri f. nagariensis]